MTTSNLYFQILNDELLPSSFENSIVHEKCMENELHIRSSVKNMNDIDKWVTEFSLNTKTQWNSRHSVPQGKQMVCLKHFVCHHSNFMKVDRNLNPRGHAMSKNANCPAKIIIKIKLTTQDTAKKDPYIKKNLPAIIRVFKGHSHKLETSKAYRFLQDRDKIQKDKFIGYFNDSMTPAEAKHFHEGFLQAIDTLEEDFANGCINPSMRTVNYWFSLWREENLGPRDGPGVIEKLREKIGAYEEHGVTIVFREDPFCVFILTPIMRRDHDLPMAKDIVFCDTTSSCDPQHHSVTFLLTPCAVQELLLWVS